MKKLILLLSLASGFMQNTFCMSENEIALAAYNAAGEQKKPTQADLNNPDYDEEVTCQLCFDKYNNSTVIKTIVPCKGKHKYCRGCLDKWFVNSRTCPECREAIAKPLLSQGINQDQALYIEAGIALLFGMGAEYCFNANQAQTTGQKCAYGACYAAAFTGAQYLLARYNKPRTNQSSKIAASWTAGLGTGFVAAHSMRQKTSRKRSQKKGDVHE